jgi:hypothetical protein
MGVCSPLMLQLPFKGESEDVVGAASSRDQNKQSMYDYVELSAVTRSFNLCAYIKHHRKATARIAKLTPKQLTFAVNMNLGENYCIDKLLDINSISISIRCL